MLEKTDLSERNIVYIGIDPGWKNLGFAITTINPRGGKVSKAFTKNYNPSEYKSINIFTEELFKQIRELTTKVDYVTIERYVAYEGVHTPNGEEINIIIGSLSNSFWNKFCVEPSLVRAIDWKMKLVKALFKKKGFQNPSTSLDKGFSDAAAIAAIDEDENGPISKLQTNHESDALCLSVVPIYVGTIK